MEFDFFNEIFSKANAKGSRSTALKPLGWLVGICASATILSYNYNAPIWIGTMFGILSTLTVMTYLGVYIFLVLKNPDALRSERFLIQQLAIQKSFIGDNKAGYMRPKGFTLVRELGPDSIDEPSEGKKE